MESGDDPIAVVAVACNYPGGSSDPEALWRMLCDGKSGFGPVPPGRWPGDSNAARRSARSGGFLDDPFPYAFDARFFDISPAEAIALDPQQRLLLEVGWRALEAGGICVEPVAGRPIGVFVAISTADYQQAKLWQSASAGADSFTATGVSFATAAGRLSYCFGFTGPSMAVDTACSSSLVAVHLARQAIRNGECEAALVAGVNALLTPNLFACLDTMNLLSPDGECRAFDSSANGYVRAEGCGALILKPLEAALRDGNEILALCRGSSINQDGRTAGLTAPSGAAQGRVIARALADAGLEPGDIDYVEAHGTGTPLGDAIELNALADSYARGRDEASPLLIGSVKANIGHLEAGAGLAGMIKTILCIRHATIPGHPRLNRPTPHFAWDEVALRVPTETTPWPSTGRPRRAGISSFGFSGTNAHVILEQAPAPEPRRQTQRGAVVLPISARTPAALEESAAAVADWLEAAPRDLVDAAFTLGAGRTPFAYRRAVVGDNCATLARSLRGGPQGPQAEPECDSGRARQLELADIWAAGGDVDWAGLYRPAGAKLVAAPGHPFHPQRYWLDPVSAASAPRRPESTDLPDRFENWCSLVREQAETILGDLQSAPLDIDRPLTDQGFTSLLGLELRRALEAKIGRRLPVSLLYDHPTLSGIARLLAGADRPPAAEPRPAAPPAEPGAGSEFDYLDTLTAAELAELIEREMDES